MSELLKIQFNILINRVKDRASINFTLLHDVPMVSGPHKKNIKSTCFPHPCKHIMESLFSDYHSPFWALENVHTPVSICMGKIYPSLVPTQTFKANDTKPEHLT